MKKSIWIFGIVAILVAASLVFFFFGREKTPENSQVSGEIPNLEAAITNGEGWSFDEATGTLTVTGDYPSQEWRDFTTAIRNLVIEEGVTVIDWGAFSGCSGLTEVVLPSSVGMVVDSAFDDCGLEKLTILNPACYVVQDVQGKGELAKVICSYEDSRAKEYHTLYPGHDFETLDGTAAASDARPANRPEGASSFGTGWYYFGGTGTMVITEDNWSQEWQEFKEEIRDLAFDIHVTEIGAKAFAGCTGLEGIVILPANVIRLTDSAFDGCGLKELVIWNPDCEIAVDVNGLSELAEKIRGSEGSLAEEWAAVTGHAFEALGARTEGFA